MIYKVLFFHCPIFTHVHAFKNYLLLDANQLYPFDTILTRFVESVSQQPNILDFIA